MSTAVEQQPLKTLAETSPRYLTEAMVEFKIEGDPTGAVKDYLQRCREILCQKMEEKVPMERVVRLQSLMTDRMVVALYKHAFEQSQARGVIPIPLALFALGGYGRAELNLFSDIDLLFLYEGKVGSQLEFVTKQMLYPLWDAGVELGYSIRTLKDCKAVMKEDSRAMSSMLDARFLAGDRVVAEKFLAFLESKFSTTRALGDFVAVKAAETEERLKRFGSSVYMLEPNLKESEGGLRDWHLIRYYSRIALKTPAVKEWVRRGLISEEEADALQRALDFLWNVRNRLHRRLARCQDQLTFELQEPIAEELGFATGGGSLGVEKFRQAYYHHAATLHRLLAEVTRRLLRPPNSVLQRIKKRLKTKLSEYFYGVDGYVVPKDYASLEKHPVELMRAFFLAQKNRLELDEELKSFIGRHLNVVDEAYRGDAEVAAMFREMFAEVGGIGKSLAEMHGCRFLGAILPEFGDILFQTQHDVYHIYTVDAHSIFAVQELSKLQNGDYDEAFPLFKRTLGEVARPDLLVLSVLFHDIGKGKGGHHSERGAEIALRIMTRLKYPEADIQEVEFQVRSHLLMPHLSQRRDLEDFNLISQFARSMETLNRLNMLFILTWADIRAVGPDVWTPWKGNLLQDLYMKTKKILETGEFNPERALTLMKLAKENILQLAGSGTDSAALKRYLDSMPPRYFLANTPAAILGHFQIIQNLPEDGFLFQSQIDLQEKLNRILIYTFNTPRLFQQVTGVMAANQVNILAFEQFFNSKGEALLLLKVTDHRGGPLEEARRIQSLERDLREVVRGQVSMERYSQLHQSQLYLGKKMSSKPPRVEIDNDVSAYYTVIDVYANDRVGILHDIARALRSLGLYIEVSKISTKVDQVADVFYVKDIFGHKITDAKKLSGIKQDLVAALTESPKEA